MKTNISKKIAYWASVIVIGAVVGVALQFAKAWSEPTLPPPTNNVGAPITTGGDLQTKAGALRLGNYLEVAGGAVLNTSGATNALVIQSGNLCFGSDCRDGWSGSTWPDGHYCIIQAQNQGCPAGFSAVNPSWDVNSPHNWHTPILGGSSSRYNMTLDNVPGASSHAYAAVEWAFCCK